MDSKKASALAKQYGCKSTAEVSRIVNRSRGVLNRWAIQYPELYKAVCLGARQIKEEEKKDEI